MRFSLSALQSFSPSKQRLAAALRSYFYSGWAFLIPYLAFYLLYYVTKWPVNPSRLMENGEVRMQNGWVPPLLHVYWVLHAVHVILAGVALWSWWRDRRQESGVRSQDRTPAAPSLVGQASEASALRHPTSDVWPVAIRLAPWLLLALLFYIPGVYLEWPSDPWEHLRRINEWRILDTVGAHSSWYKSAYFIPYSLLSWCIGLRQLFWLDFYYTGICLLLCWQYYRLSRACGLGDRASMVFVIIQALLFGNNIFSFYRYYGISSSIYAQIGAIALTRLVLEWATFGKTNLNHSDTEPTEARLSVRQPFSSSALQPFRTRPSFWHLPSLFWLLTSSSCLLLLTAFNHLQGVGIAGLGIGAILVWRLIEWKRSALWWLIGGTIVANALFLWGYTQPQHIDSFRSAGWVGAWYGFNIIDPSSPAFDRMMQIVSPIGLINLCCCALLGRRNPVTWLTLVSPVGLLLPCLALPVLSTITTHGGFNYVVTFQRLLFTTPFALAIVAYCARRLEPSSRLPRSRDEAPASRCHFRFLLLELLPFAAIAAAVALGGGMHGYSRFWHNTAVSPADLQLYDVVGNHREVVAEASTREHVTSVGVVAALAVANAISPRNAASIRGAGIPSSSLLKDILAQVNEVPPAENHAPRVELGHPQTPPTTTTGAGPLQNPTNIAVIVPSSDAWAHHDGTPVKIAHLREGGTSVMTLETQTDQKSEVWSKELLPISTERTYAFRMTTRSTDKATGIAVPFVAWYDARGELLNASLPLPGNGGNPRGWRNGELSYGQLVRCIPSSSWVAYEFFLGRLTSAAIPANARYCRVGVLLETVPRSGGRMQIKELSLVECPPPSMEVFSAHPLNAVSAASQAALMSTHWPAQQAAIDRGGSKELRSTGDNAHNRRGQAR